MKSIKNLVTDSNKKEDTGIIIEITSLTIRTGMNLVEESDVTFTLSA